MKRATRIGAAAAIAGLGLLVWLGVRGEARLVETAAVRVGPFEVGFQEEGKTRLRERYRVAAPIGGWLRRIEIEEGDRVTAGQVVAEIQPTVTGLLDPGSRARARAEADSAASALAAARQRVTALRAGERLAGLELQRLQVMKSSNAVSQSQLDAAQAGADQARAELAVAVAEQRMMAQRLQAAESVLSQEGVGGGGSALPVLAPVDGQVIERYVESEGPVAAAQALLELGNPADIEIEVEALSTDAVKVKPGMAARVLRWGGEGALDARVTRVEPGGYTKISALGVEEQRVRIVLDITSPPERWAGLGDAYRVEVEFVLTAGERVLQVPASALFRHEGRWAVYLADGGRARRVAVEIGASGATAAEVRAGLTAGQRVILFPDDRIADGVRLRDATPHP
ncbi:MAG TPA: HlyD family efflux transporter periplasmic adaptor subunit [Pseudomonadota bacterium]|nr:HlyD family efflux transporter periplasmic adaptor subunit [Pseudomonadota bacterium]HRA36674.1 HlyD family efflux transporter periplasmic adaptor subunit [Pseudomonadota bacterium]